MPSLQELKFDLSALADVLGLPARLGSHRCTFHADNNPSLSIRRLENGVICFKCFSCGRHGTIVQAVAHKNGFVDAFGDVDDILAIKHLGCSASLPVRQPNYRKVEARGDDAGIAFPNPVPYRKDSVMDRIDEELHSMSECPFRASDWDRPQHIFVDQQASRKFQERGIPEGVGHFFRFVYMDLMYLKGRRETTIVKHSWMIPIRDLDNNVVAIKLHSESLQGPKGKWICLGGQKQGVSTFFPNPEEYDTDSLAEHISDWPALWRAEYDNEFAQAQSYYQGILCDEQIRADVEREIRKKNKRKQPTLSDQLLYLLPGELKAAAMIGAGFQAVGVTAGEACAWKPALLKRLAGRSICIVYDDDEAGRKFRDKTIEALRCICPRLHAITFGKRDDGWGKIKKIDANNMARERGPDGLKKMVDWLVARKPNLARKPFRLADERIELKRRVKEACKAKSGVFIFRPPVGTGKSFSASECMNEADDTKFSVFTGSHMLAMEFEGRSPNALRLVSPKRASMDGLIKDDAGNVVECPSLARIERLYSNCLPYVAKVCSECPFRKTCPVITQQDRLEDSRINILQHQHLRIAKSKYFKDRVRIIDETALNSMQWTVKFDDDKLNSFSLLLNRFKFSEHGKSHFKKTGSLEALVRSIKALGLAQSVNVYEPIDQYFIGDWSKFLTDDNNESSFNLLTDLSRSMYQFIRCDIIDGARGYWLVRGELPDNYMPTIILDATAPADTYRELFANRTVTIWPDDEPPAPQSDVVQMIDGLYPRATLLTEVDEADGKKKLVPADAYKSIVAEIKKAAEVLGIAEHQMGLISLKRVSEHLRKDLPAAQHMHFGALRGLNGMKDCRLVAVIGCQPPPDGELAWQAATLFKQNLTPETLIPNRNRGRHARKWTPVKSECGDGYEVNAIDLRDPRLNLVWSIAVTSEVVQAIGRARPYEERTERQTVLVYCNQPLPLSVSRACTRAEFRSSLGIGEKVDGIAGRVLDGMASLKDADGAFGYKELAEKMGISESTLKNRKYQDAINSVKIQLGLTFKRGGDGQEGEFQS